MPFCGKPTDDLSSFLNHFERFSTFCGWGDDQKLRALPLYFQGNASSWFSCLPGNFRSYEDLVKALKDKFSNPASVWLWRQQLSVRKQAETESLAEYASDIRRLCKRLGLGDAQVMHHFIQGLHAELKNHVILGQPKSLAEAENLANLKETVLINNPNFTQQKLEVQLQSVAKRLETLAIAQQNNTPNNVAAYDRYTRVSERWSTVQ